VFVEVSVYSNSILRVILESNPSSRHTARQSDYAAGECIVRDNTPIVSVYFPSRGILVSTLTADDGSDVELGLYDRRSVIGGAAAFGAKTRSANCLGQIAGIVWAIPSEVLIESSRKSESLRGILARHEQFVLSQAQYRAVCNAKHPLRQRLATRLLRAYDMYGQMHLEITQEHLASRLGVQRATLSTVAARLQDEGIIEVRRGRITLLDVSRIAAEACSCCAALRERETDLLEPKQELSFH
jgi:CRP-like cAMP-binding protein